MASWHDVASLGVVLAVLGGCALEEAPPPPPKQFDSLAAHPCPDHSTLTYESFGEPFLNVWCNGCHSSEMPEGMRGKAPLGVDFDDIELVRSQTSRIWARAGDHNATMPPVGGPEAEERTNLGEWLACGAPVLQ